MKENSTFIKINELIGKDAYRLCFEVDWPSYNPGQFVMISISGKEVFLRRPFSIAGLSQGLAEICYKVVGKGTRALALAPAGIRIDVAGPFGKGFEMPDSKNTLVLVAGGYGIAPFVGLCRKIGKGAVIYYGAKSISEFLYLDELEKMKVKVVFSTEDGSKGHKGMITQVLERDLNAIKNPALISSGPKGLLEAIAKMGLSKDIPTQVSMEEYMACGMGVCNGCVCKGKDGEFLKTCSDGPVFRAEELKW
ncbi:MAG: dihydroorotate dehydrogenase electron transfer subunit [Pseudomonadota bacterium]